MSKRIFFTSLKGGAGTTTLAVFIGRALACLGARTLIVDGDNLCGYMIAAFNLFDKCTYTMQDAYLGDCRVKQVVIGDSKQPNCYFLPTFNCTSAKFIDECVESLDGLFDYIICDGIAKNSCNSAYVITQPYPATFNSANYCICKLKDDGFDDVSLIVNMAKGSLIRDGYTPSPCDIAELLHVKLLAIIPEDTGLCINSPKRSTLKAFDMAAKSIYKNSDKMFKLESCDKKLLFNRQRQVTL